MWKKIIRDFVAKDRQERLLFFANSEKRCERLYHELLHVPSRFAKECCVTIAPSEQNADAMLAQMKAMGAEGLCWAYSLHDEIDQRMVPLDEALNASVGSCAETILYFENQGLAYYEGGHCDRLILKRLPNRKV